VVVTPAAGESTAAAESKPSPVGLPVEDVQKH
jgi:hypothetical protein